MRRKGDVNGDGVGILQKRKGIAPSPTWASWGGVRKASERGGAELRGKNLIAICRFTQQKEAFSQGGESCLALYRQQPNIQNICGAGSYFSGLHLCWWKKN